VVSQLSVSSLIIHYNVTVGDYLTLTSHLQR